MSSDEELQRTMQEFNQKQAEQEQNRQIVNAISQSPMNSNMYQNSVVEWQLDLSKEFELIYHQLRGHVLKRIKEGEFWDEPRKKVMVKILVDEDGTKYWVYEQLEIVIKSKEKKKKYIDYNFTEGKEFYDIIKYKDMEFLKYKNVEIIDYDQKLLNERGAQEIEKIIRNYLNKNVLLSNFTEVLIKERVGEFAHRLRRFLYLNYEEFGLDSYYKQKHFEMIVMNIVDVIEAAYYRALNGEERKSLTTIRTVVQQESFDNKISSPTLSSGGGKTMNPMKWFKNA